MIPSTALGITYTLFGSIAGALIGANVPDISEKTTIPVSIVIGCFVTIAPLLVFFTRAAQKLIDRIESMEKLINDLRCQNRDVRQYLISPTDEMKKKLFVEHPIEACPFKD